MTINAPEMEGEAGALGSVAPGVMEVMAGTRALAEKAGTEAKAQASSTQAP